MHTDTTPLNTGFGEHEMFTKCKVKKDKDGKGNIQHEHMD